MAKKTYKKKLKSHDKSLDFTPAESFGLILRKTYQAFLKALEERVSPYNVTVPQWFFLRVLWEEDGLTQRELSEKVGITESTTVAALKVMQRRGFVRCVSDKSDKRRKNIILTKTGQELKNVLLPKAYELHLNATDGLSEEQIQRTREVLLHMQKQLESGEDKRLLLREIRMLRDELKKRS